MRPCRISCRRTPPNPGNPSRRGDTWLAPRKRELVIGLVSTLWRNRTPSARALQPRNSLAERKTETLANHIPNTNQGTNSEKNPPHEKRHRIPQGATVTQARETRLVQNCAHGEGKVRSAGSAIPPILITDHDPPLRARTALNVPYFDGRSPTSGENSASPVIKSAVSNFPLQVNVPASRPTLPSRNSTGPENVTEFPSPRVHVASDGFAAPQTLDFGSAGIKVPFPSAWASRRTERCSAFPKVISTFQVPVMLGVWA